MIPEVDSPYFRKYGMYIEDIGSVEYDDNPLTVDAVFSRFLSFSYSRGSIVN